MKCRKHIMKELFSIIFILLIQETITEECGWAHRIERFLLEPEAMEGSWPWMLEIMKQNSDGAEVQSCSGCIISSKHVLSAAHCFDHRKPSLYKAKIGNVDQRLAQDYNITRIVLHDSYVHGQYYGDIAILTLARNVDTDNFNPICLPRHQGFANVTGQLAAVVGWGSTNAGGPIYPKLREKFGLLIIPNSRCQKIIDDSRDFDRIFPHGVGKEMICTASPNDCVGNGGSPLMIQVEEQWYVVGVKTFGWACDISDYPTGYTRVAEYLNWIERNVNFACGWAPRINSSNENGTSSTRFWPWMVAIFMRNRRGTYDHLCSGSMISKRHALVAAHCFQRRDPALYKARIGLTNDTLAQEYNITRIVPHDKFVRGVFYNDIAILTLDKDVDSENFNPICLPSNHDFVNLEGQNNAVVGWELSLYSEHPKLKETFGLEVIPNSRCREIYRTFRRQIPQGVGDGMICIADTEACFVESGSPLMYNNEGTWYIAGLDSFGFSCDTSPDFPTGFTRVSEYLKWIEDNIKS